MRILFTCGGTAGHINPALALAGALRQRRPDTEILFAGATRGMENELVPRAGYTLRTVPIMRLQRTFNAFGIRYNLKSIRAYPAAQRQAASIIREFDPDVVAGMGGYASEPFVRQAAKCGIPTLIHESNAVPGLTTKMLARHADRVLVGFEESRAHYPHPDRVLVTGTPVRGDFFSLTRAEARAKLQLPDERPLVLSYFGSLGARAMNEAMVDFIQAECAAGDPFHHIHGMGGNFGGMPEALSARGIRLADHPAVSLREYIYDMPVVMAAADLIVCRSGASTLAELTALARPAILIPSPNVTGHHQEKNAALLGGRGAALVFSEGEGLGERIFKAARELLSDPERLSAMRRAAGSVAEGDAAARICDVILDLARQKRA